MQRFARRALLLVLPVLLAGCSKSIVAIANCNVGNMVSVSRKDVLTEQTAREIDENNKSRIAAGCKSNG